MQLIKQQVKIDVVPHSEHDTVAFSLEELLAVLVAVLFAAEELVFGESEPVEEAGAARCELLLKLLVNLVSFPHEVAVQLV